MKILNWNNLSDSKKKELSVLKPAFIFGSRELSEDRILALTKIAKKKKILWGVLKDKFIEGFGKSPQFRTQDLKQLKELVKENENIIFLEYFQRDINFIINEIDISAAILINGSWYRRLHFRPEFWSLINHKIPYKLTSPFNTEEEAKEYAWDLQQEIEFNYQVDKSKEYSQTEIMQLVDSVEEMAFATDFRTAAILSKGGKILEFSHNTVVPFETYAMHYGSEPEKYFSPQGDLNHYDTNHAEVELLIKANQNKTDLKDTELYINLMPCPTCARMLCRTGIKKVFYKHDHSEAYAFRLFEKCGIECIRL